MRDEKQKWASEPWSLSVYDDGDAYATHCATGRYINFKNEEILSRVLDCINALAGIPDPQEFVEAAKELYKRSKSLCDIWDCYCPDDSDTNKCRLCRVRKSITDFEKALKCKS